MRSGAFPRYVLPALGLMGVLGAVVYVGVETSRVPAPPQQIGLPPSSGFKKSISSSGLIEANTRNIRVGSSLSGIVTKVFVVEGDVVEKGAPLFKLDDRTAKADIETKESDVYAAQTQIEEAKAALADQKDQLQRAQNMKAGFSITVDRLERLKFAEQAAATRLSAAKANYEAAKSRLAASRVAFNKLTVTAPVSGKIFKSKLREGEFVQASADADLIVMGNDKPLYVRVSIDENDIWRFRSESSAVGVLRSNSNIKFPVTFVRAEPYVQPKRSLTGSTSERVDTRVMELVYKIEETEHALYIGQQVDVFIDDDVQK